MSEINTEQDNKKEQALETTQKIKKPEGLEPASSDLPALLAVLSVLVVVFFISMIFQNAPTATTSKSQQSAKASASACPDGYQQRRAVSVDDFNPDDSYDIIIVGHLWVEKWGIGRSVMAMTSAELYEGPSMTVYINPRDYKSFLRKYRDTGRGSYKTGMVMKGGQIVDLINYSGAIHNGMLCVEE